MPWVSNNAIKCISLLFFANRLRDILVWNQVWWTVQIPAVGLHCGLFFGFHKSMKSAHSLQRLETVYNWKLIICLVVEGMHLLYGAVLLTYSWNCKNEVQSLPVFHSWLCQSLPAPLPVPLLWRPVLPGQLQGRTWPSSGGTLEQPSSPAGMSQSDSTSSGAFIHPWHHDWAFFTAKAYDHGTKVAQHNIENVEQTITVPLRHLNSPGPLGNASHRLRCTGQILILKKGSMIMDFESHYSLWKYLATFILFVITWQRTTKV